MLFRIKKELIEFLKGKTIVGGNVFSSREKKGPGAFLSVFTSTEEAVKYSEAPKSSTRMFPIKIETKVSNDVEKIEEYFDFISAQVHQKMIEFFNHNKIVTSVDYAKTDVSIESGADKPVGFISLTYIIGYIHDDYVELEEKDLNYFNINEVQV